MRLLHHECPLLRNRCLTKRVSVAPGTGTASAGAVRRPPCSCCDSDGRDAAGDATACHTTRGGGAGRQLQTPVRAAPPTPNTSGAPQEFSPLRLKGASVLRPCWDCYAPRPSHTIRYYHIHHRESIALPSARSGAPASQKYQRWSHGSGCDCRSARSKRQPRSHSTSSALAVALQLAQATTRYQDMNRGAASETMAPRESTHVGSARSWDGPRTTLSSFVCSWCAP